jgi:hypothetical protein
MKDFDMLMSVNDRIAHICESQPVLGTAIKELLSDYRKDVLEEIISKISAVDKAISLGACTKIIRGMMDSPK